MKSMKKFAAQQLTKKEMTKIQGGAGGFDNCGTLYAVSWPGGSSYVCSKDTVAMEQFRLIGAEFVCA